MKTRLLVFLAGVTAGLANADDAPPDEVLFVDRAVVAQAFAEGGTLVKNAAYKVLAGRRVQPGMLEIHERDTDVFYVVAGRATLVTGGVSRDLSNVAPGEARGSGSDGGAEHQLESGDVIVIPAGIPHWFKTVEGEFRYFVVKITR